MAGSVYQSDRKKVVKNNQKTTIAAGGSHSLFLKDDGSLWAMGVNGNGQLGNGNTSYQYNPVQVIQQGVAQIAAGDSHSLFLKDDGSLWAMGYNDYGQLGNGNTSQQNNPVQVIQQGVAQIAAGANHSLFLKDDGSLWAMGYNNYGQLGNGNTSQQNNPVQVIQQGVAQIAAGANHSLFLKDDGSLWAMGYNSYGQLGNGNTNYSNPNPVQVIQQGVAQIAAGSSHSLFLKDDGSLWAMGANWEGQLGNGNTSNQNNPVQVIQQGVAQIVAGESHSLFLKDDGSLWAMGRNSYGQLGNGNTSQQNNPVQVIQQEVAQIAANNDHSLFLKDDGSLWAMGRNSYGQLGNGNTNYSVPNPVRIYPPMGSGDWDGDGISNDREITDGTNALDPQDFNLITNGNFEDGLNAWTFDDGNTNSGSLEVESSTSNVNEGSQSAKLSRTSTEYVRMYTAPISFSNQKNYQLSFQLKDYNSSFHPGDKMEFRFADGTVEEMNASVSFTPLNNSWTEVSMLFSVTPPTGSTESNTASSGLPTTWNQNTSYAKSALVISNTSTYLAQLAVPAGTAISNTTYWYLLDGQTPPDSNSTTTSNSGLPTTWNQNTSYASGSLVISNGSTFLAQQAVPAGTAITSTAYWVSLNAIIPNTTTETAPTTSPDVSTAPTATPTSANQRRSGSSGVPSTWSQISTYSSGALVILNGKTYIAQQSVPAGTAISSTAYWQVLDSAVPTSTPGTAPSSTPDVSTSPSTGPTNSDSGNDTNQTWNMSIQFAKFKTGTQYLDHFVLRAIPKSQVFEPIDYGSVAQGNEMNNTIHSHITLYVNGVEQGNELFSKQPVAKLQATGNNYLGGIDDFNQYDQSLNSAEIAQSFREEKDLPPYTFLFTPKETPASLKIQSGSLTMDEARLYDRGVSESDLVKLFHLDLAPNARDFDLSLADPTDSPIESLMLVDLNNDGKLDILTEQANDKFSWSQNKFQTTSKHNGWPNYDYTYTTTGEMAEIKILWPEEEIRSLPQWKSGQESNATSGLADMFVVNWNENGKINQLIQAGGSSNYDLSAGNAIVAGKEGEVYLTGSFGKELQWGDLNTSGPGSFENAFISRLDQELSPTWVKSFDGGDGAAGQAIAIDQRGDIQVTGYFRGDLTSGQANLTSNGGTDAFLLQLDAYGNAISLRAHGGSGNDIGTGISADSQGGIIMAGTFEQTGEFFGDSNMTVLSAGKKDAFILRYDYQIVIPKQHFQVTVGMGADGSNKFFIDGEEAPDIELLRGLPYTFTLDGNTTENHPFYLALQGQGGDEYGWEYLQGVQNSRTTDGTLTFSLGFEGPSVLHYNCGLHSGMGGSLIIPSDERPRAAITYAAIDMGGNFIEDGNWTVSTSNGLPVYSGQSLLDSEKVLLTYHPPAGYFLVGWGGDLETDANATGSSIEVNLNQDRAIQALLTAYAPTPLELANNFTIGFTIRPTDETGQFVESNDTLISYDGGFSLDPDSTLTTGTGKFSVNQDAKLDLNQDGQSDTLRADFTYLVSTSDWVTINMENLESDLGDGWDLFGGGGFTMTLAVDAINGSKHEGGYSILYDDGSSELGNWLSTNLRIDPISLLSE